MIKLMQIIVLSCKQATFYSSLKRFRKLSMVRKMQLWMHLSMCKVCHEYDHQSEIIDHTLHDFHQNESLLSEEKLSTEKKSEIKSTVNQYNN